MFRFYCNSAYKSFGIFNIAFSQAYKVQSVVNQVALAKRVGVNPGFRVRINSAHYRYGSMCIHSASVVQAAVAYISVLAAILPTVSTLKTYILLTLLFLLAHLKLKGQLFYLPH